MIEIKELKANKLPNLTSLYIQIPYNKEIYNAIEQQPIKYKDKKNNIYELPINRLFFLVSLLIKIDDVKFIPYKEEKKEIQGIDGYEFKIKPYKHQLEAIEYGLNHQGWLLLDEMGLGKSLSAIYLAEILKQKEDLKHCLIICGISSLRYNWAEEISKFSRLDYKILGQTITKKGKSKIVSVKERCEELKKGIKEFFVITNKETLQSKEFIEAFNKSKSKFDMIVYDEAQTIKNPSSLSAKTLLKMKSKRNIALTGTLIMNNPENAYVPLKWTGNLNCSYGTFKNMYNVYGGFGGVQVVGFKNLDLLREQIKKCSLRRLKTDIVDLPPKTYKIEYVELGKEQRELYDNVAKGIAEELDLLPTKQQLTIAQEMTMNMRLRQITANPKMLTTEDIPSAKLDRLDELLEDITSQGDKVLVFYTFKGTTQGLDERYKKYNPLICTGDQSDEEIDRNKKIFSTDEKYKVMFCTWQKMGTGHTLVAANYCIFIDTPWTDAAFSQACDRIYRIGQCKNCYIITLIAKDTYDERVQEILEFKEKLSDYVIDETDNGLTQINDIKTNIG